MIQKSISFFSCKTKISHQDLKSKNKVKSLLVNKPFTCELYTKLSIPNKYIKQPQLK